MAFSANDLNCMISGIHLADDALDFRQLQADGDAKQNQDEVGDTRAEGDRGQHGRDLVPQQHRVAVRYEAILALPRALEVATLAEYVLTGGESTTALARCCIAPR